MSMTYPLRRIVFTVLLTLIAFCATAWVWHYYMYSPWTRDGRVRVYTAVIAPDVSGLVTAVPVRDNQEVHKGDVLMTIDRERYAIALTQAQALVDARKAEADMRASEAQRRAGLGDDVITQETRADALAQAAAAQAHYQEAQAQLDRAKLDLERTQVRSPVDGYVSNLTVREGNYTSAGKASMAVIDKNSFWVYGYFEETKLPLVHIGDRADMRLMGGAQLQGYVESIARGIGDRENATGSELLADVNPTFNWVRLAQRIPVRIHIDQVPDGTLLAAGMTCTVILHPAK